MTDKVPDVTARAEPIGDLTYTSWSRLHRCPLQVIFNRDPSTCRLDRGNPASALGTARHRIGEIVAAGRRAGRKQPSRDWVRQRFDQLLEEERSRIVDQWSPSVVPPVRTWPDVALSRLRAVTDLGAAGGENWGVNQLEHRGARVDTASEAAAGTLPGQGDVLTEAVFRDDQRGFWGRIDRVENRDGTIAVIDLKSGVGVSESDLAKRHRIQMLFYAGLINAAHKIWPVLELHPTHGTAVAINYSAEDVEAVRAQAVHDRAQYNARARQGIDVATGVDVTPTRCAWCPFQVACPAYRNQWTSKIGDNQWRRDRSVSLAYGVVTAMQEHQAGTDVTLEQHDDLTAPAGEVIVTRLPRRLGAGLFDMLAVAQVAVAGSERVLRAQWDSRYWIGRRSDGHMPTRR